VVKVIWQKAASPQHMDDSIVFARWRQCSPPCNTCFLGPRESSTQTASWSVQPFLHSSRQRVRILYNRRPRPPQNCFFPWGHLDSHLIHDSFGLFEPTSQTASRLDQPFLYSSPPSVHVLHNGLPLPPQNCVPSSHRRIWTTSNKCF